MSVASSRESAEPPHVGAHIDAARSRAPPPGAACPPGRTRPRPTAARRASSRRARRRARCPGWRAALRVRSKSISLRLPDPMTDRVAWKCPSNAEQKSELVAGCPERLQKTCCQPGVSAMAIKYGRPIEARLAPVEAKPSRPPRPHHPSAPQPQGRMDAAHGRARTCSPPTT